MSSRTRVRGRSGVAPPLAAAAVGFGALGLYVAAWRLFVTGPGCQAGAVAGCTGASIAMAVVGLPVLYAVWALGLRLTGARHAALAPLAIGLALFVLARIIGYYGMPVLVWLVTAALLSGGWRLRFRPER